MSSKKKEKKLQFPKSIVNDHLNDHLIKIMTRMRNTKALGEYKTFKDLVKKIKKLFQDLL